MDGLIIIIIIIYLTTNVAAGFGRHSMPPPLMTQVQHWDKTPQSDHVTLRPWPLTLEVMAPVGVVILHPYTKFEVRMSLGVWKIWCTMCVSINGPSDLDLWSLDLETGIGVASKVGTFVPNLGTPGLRVLELFTMYVTNGRTDERTDKSNAYCPHSLNNNLSLSTLSWDR